MLFAENKGKIDIHFYPISYLFEYKPMAIKGDFLQPYNIIHIFTAF